MEQVLDTIITRTSAVETTSAGFVLCHFAAVRRQSQKDTGLALTALIHDFAALQWQNEGSQEA